jgi:CheB methylesterase
MLPLPPYRRSKTPIDRAVICLALLASDTNVENGVAPGRRCIQFQNLTAVRPSVCCHARVNYPPLQPIPRSTLDAILTQAARSRPLLPYIHLAPPGRHLPVESDELRLGSGPRENNARPALDPLFRSTGLCCGPRAIGSILAVTLGDGAAPAWRSGSAVASPWCKTRAMPPFRKCPRQH